MRNERKKYIFFFSKTKESNYKQNVVL